MDRKQLEKLSLGVRCPTCGAGPRQKCELNTGQPRTAPHRGFRRALADHLRRSAVVWLDWTHGIRGLDGRGTDYLRYEPETGARAHCRPDRAGNHAG